MASPTPERKDTIRAHWKCLAACTLMSMCPFQYGVDFGIIGSLQAMEGFLKVGYSRLNLLLPVLNATRSSVIKIQHLPLGGTSLLVVSN
jgi:hypothetical protein